MIENGSLTPGVDPADFGLPEPTAFRFEIAAPDVADYVSDYHVLDSEGPLVDGVVE